MKKNILLFAFLLLLFGCGSVPEGNNRKEIKKLDAGELVNYFTDKEIEQMQALRYGNIDPICVIQGLRGIAHYTDTELINITPNPTSSSVNVKLLLGFLRTHNAEDSRKHKPVSVHFQLLFNERIIRQWNVDSYSYLEDVVIIPEEYLKESGTYLLVCNFTGTEGCTASAAASFMVVKK